MLTLPILHPDILRALASAGHGSKVLITDGNFPHSTGSNPNAVHVYLNLAPGVLNVTEVLKVISQAIPVEEVEVMATADGSEPPIWTEFRTILHDMKLNPLERFTFYEAAKKVDVALVIATGEQRVYANIMLTIGVVRPPPNL
eukprot:TRINITY_DN3848_c0_g1_i1.p1 TRINITY_DN3848_c0_g1~~TRINITY_DN3848_c0_g1_i1.p1  ORF type:complete len:143 (-),score=33.24 TRINITY_DN3848_c0_g1_i1:28-456(-)